MKKIFTLILLLACTFCFAQNLNNYKYVVVPQKFEFQKEPGQFDINNLARMMFEKYGFTVLMEGSQYPTDLALDRCKALYADIQNSGLIHTNFTIFLKDCSGTAVFTSATGRSKEKDRKKAYYEAMREASHSLAGLNYKYAAKVTVRARLLLVLSLTKRRLWFMLNHQILLKLLLTPTSLRLSQPHMAMNLWMPKESIS